MKQSSEYVEKEIGDAAPKKKRKNTKQLRCNPRIMSAKNAKKKKKRKVAKGLDRQSMGPKGREEVGNDAAKLLRSIEIQRLTPLVVFGGNPALVDFVLDKRLLLCCLLQFTYYTRDFLSFFLPNAFMLWQ